jgi:hypothetical protein
MVVALIRIVFRDIAARRLEDDIDVATRAQGCDEFGGVEMVGAEIMEHGPLIVVEQRLDVDELQRPVILEDVPAEIETAGPVLFELTGTFEIVGSGEPEDRGQVGGRGRGGDFLGRDRVNPGQHLAQLRPAMGTDDHRLATFEVGQTRDEPTHLGPQTVSY